jgi:hypothetical protein
MLRKAAQAKAYFLGWSWDSCSAEGKARRGWRFNHLRRLLRMQRRCASKTQPAKLVVLMVKNQGAGFFLLAQQRAALDRVGAVS